MVALSSHTHKVCHHHTCKRSSAGYVYSDNSGRRVQGLPTRLSHFTLCFDHGARRLWILPTPTDPITRFVEVMEGRTLPVRTLPEGEYHVCVALIRTDNRVCVREVVDKDGDLGGRF